MNKINRTGWSVASGQLSAVGCWRFASRKSRTGECAQYDFRSVFYSFCRFYPKHNILHVMHFSHLLAPTAMTPIALAPSPSTD